MSQTKAQLLDGSVVSVSFGAGSAAAPSINYSADSTTGIYFPGSGQLAISTNSSQRLAIDSSGAVTIPGTLGVTGAITGSSTVTGTALIPSGSSVPVNGIYLPSANSVAISTNSSQRLAIDSSGAVTIPGTLGVTGAITGSSTITSAAGSATANGIQVGTGTTYKPGIYSPGTDQLAISTSGTGRLFVTSGGLVGLGTNDPKNTLHVASGNIGFGRFSDQSVGTRFIGLTGTTGYETAFQAGLGISTTVANQSQDVILQSHNFGVGTNQLILKADGKVGIGTTGPATTLEVRGAVQVGNQSQGDGTTPIVSARGLFIGTNQNTGSTTEVFLQTSAYPIQPAGLNSPSQAFVFSGWSGGGVWHNAIKSGQGQFLSFHTGISGTTYTDTNERARIDSSGRLLVGTSTARANYYNSTGFAQFQIEGANYNESSLSITTNNTLPAAAGNILINKSAGASIGSNTLVANGETIGGINWQGNDGAQFVLAAAIAAYVDGAPGADDMPGRLVFSTTLDGASSPTERMRITNDGRLLVGYVSTANTTPGVINAVGYAHKQGVSGAPGTNTINFFWTGSSLQAWIDTSNVGTVTFVSDYRIKKNIQTQTSLAIPRLKQLRPVTYERANYETLFTEDGVAREGFIAHEVAAVIPSGVEGEKDAENRIQSLNIDAIVSVLTKALQEAIEKIESLEARLAALEAA